MSTRLIIFDLDGTLIDSLADLAIATNHALSLNGFPPHPIERYKHFVGNGISLLIERALPEADRNEATKKRVKADFTDYYSIHLNDNSRPYPGIPELLQELQNRFVKIAVATNKPQPAAEKIIHNSFKDISFVTIQGQVPNRETKPNPSIISDILTIANLSPEETLYMGDSGVDMQTAQNAGITGIGCLWGFRDAQELQENGADYLIKEPAELLLLCK